MGFFAEFTMKTDEVGPNPLQTLNFRIYIDDIEVHFVDIESIQKFDDIVQSRIKLVPGFQCTLLFLHDDLCTSMGKTHLQNPEADR